MIKVASITFFALFIVALSPAFSFVERSNVSKQINFLIAEIKSSPFASKRAEYADTLADHIQNLRRNNLALAIDSQTIKELTSLLADRDDGVRGMIAACLGFIGPNAQPSVPSLRRALSLIVKKKNLMIETDSVVIVQTADSEGPIRLALERITGKPRGSFSPFVHGQYEKSLDIKR